MSTLLHLKKSRSKQYTACSDMVETTELESVTFRV